MPEQREAASYLGTHSRLLAGPGTGKTLSLTRRICFLIEEQTVAPGEIQALTFTRAAAAELRGRVRSEVGESRVPKISTLHSFALRQLLKNARLLVLLPQPLRIADDWEERTIVLEDLKSLLSLKTIRDASQLLNDLSADWQSLKADDSQWEQRFPNPAFLGAWREHRDVYGYTLRSELVYQLRRALEQYEGFNLEGPPRYLLVDEYQDLNRCDLAVVKFISERGAEVFGAGDDDQSIYGFRKALPDGIRRFLTDYPGAKDLTLTVCKRCDKAILDHALFVARQDYARIEKVLTPEEGSGEGEVALLRFVDQDQEAETVARLCSYLVTQRGLSPGNILLLLRSDRDGVFSSVLRRAFDIARVPIAIATADTDPFNATTGRQVLALLRLLENERDHLAWRTLLEIRKNGVGTDTIRRVYDIAKSQGIGFADVLLGILEDPATASFSAGRLIGEVRSIGEFRREMMAKFPSGDDLDNARAGLQDAVRAVVAEIVGANDDADRLILEIGAAIEAGGCNSLSDLLQTLAVSTEDIEQELQPDRVNILTMHRAKG